MALFERGRAKTGGRLKGARNKLSAALLEALTEDFRQFGAEAIKIARREKPTEYLNAAHYTAQDREKIIASYPAHELDARTKGIPVLGSGLVFPVKEDDIKCEPFAIPEHWPKLGAMDFGWDHPFAAVKLARDRDTDTIYVTHAHRLSRATPVIHAAAVRPWGKTLPWAWPRDGRRETLEGAGIPLAAQYREQGLNMLTEHAQFKDGSVSVEAGIFDMLGRMETGRLKVFQIGLRNFASTIARTVAL